MANLKALFWPQSIVLVGASTDKTIIRGRIVEAIQRYPYTGSICAVSRSHQMIGNLKCYASVDELPGAVDLAIITIPAANPSKKGSPNPSAEEELTKQSHALYRGTMLSYLCWITSI